MTSVLTRYSDDQPRDDHGRFEGGGGGDSWASSSVPLSGGATAEVGALTDGGVSLAIAGGSVTLDSEGATQTTVMFGNAHPNDEGEEGLDVGGHVSVAVYGAAEEGDQGATYATAYIGVTCTGEDSYEVDLSRGSGDNPPETVSTTTVTGADLDKMSSEVDRYSWAQQVDTDAGSFSVVPNGDGTYASTWPGGQTVDLSQSEAQGISEGIQEATGPMDDQDLMDAEYADRYTENDDGSLDVGPNDPVGSAAVQVGAGTMTITGYGQYDQGGHVTIGAPHLSISLTISASDADSIGSAVGDDEGAAGYGLEHRAQQPLHSRARGPAKSLRQRDARRQPTKVSIVEAWLLADQPEPAVGRALHEIERLLRYSEDQPRDEQGRFGEGGGGIAVGADLVGSDVGGSAVTAAKERERYPASRDEALSAIAHEQGFDRPPTVVSHEQMDQMIQNGRPELYRGVRGNGDLSAAEIHEEMRSGDAQYGRGIYGNGYYFGTSTSGDTANAQQFSDGTQGSVARATLDPDATVVDGASVFAEHNEFMRDLDTGAVDYGDARSAVVATYSDVGRYAAARGYDVMYFGPAGSPLEQYVVLNRTALIVEEATAS